jgi:hypothetical protein
MLRDLSLTFSGNTAGPLFTNNDKAIEYFVLVLGAKFPSPFLALLHHSIVFKLLTAFANTHPFLKERIESVDDTLYEIKSKKSHVAVSNTNQKMENRQYSVL